MIAENASKVRWSVMIPTYNCAYYLEETLKSVLMQDPGREHMQIEVIDDCSTKDDPEEVVKRIGKGRISFYRHEKNVGATQNYNSCIARAKGELVHILHGDDWIENGFYNEIENLANSYPNISLYATRSFFANEKSIIESVTNELKTLRTPSNNISEFYYATPIQFSGIVVRKSFYETHDLFDPELVHTADVDMWARSIFYGGGVISPKVLSYYRVFSENDTSKLKKTAGNLVDFLRLGKKFSNNFPDFDIERFKLMVIGKAQSQCLHFLRLGDIASAKANFKFFLANTNNVKLIKFAIKYPSIFLKLLF